jgi:Protein of unknown function (DUF1367)
MAKGAFKRVGNTAIPAGKEGQEALFAIPDGKTFIADFRTARNPQLHEMFWTACQLVADATDTTKEAVKRWLLMKTGFVDLIFYPDGSMEIEPKSIAWENMEETEFRQFFNAAVPKIADLLGSAPKEVIQRFYDLLDPTTRADMRRPLRKDSPPIAPEEAEQAAELAREQA